MELAKIFTYEEALATFPTVRRLTFDAVEQVQLLTLELHSLEEMASRRAELEAAYSRIVEEWTEKVRALGCEVKGLWLVDWDSGGGYYCWCWPEESLAFFHTYEDGFQGRMPIA